MTWVSRLKKRSLKNTDGNKNNVVIKIKLHKQEVDVFYQKVVKKRLT